MPPMRVILIAILPALACFPILLGGCDGSRAGEADALDALDSVEEEDAETADSPADGQDERDARHEPEAEDVQDEPEAEDGRDTWKETSFTIGNVYEESDTERRDERLFTLRRHNNMSYEMPVYYSREDRLERAEELRTHILVSAGLWPDPGSCPMNAQIYAIVDQEDYTIQKVYFESYPGFYVTGNLYRPKNMDPPHPAVLTPHGHWDDGRLNDTDRCSVPARCINLARQGYVVFSYDMVGYLDSKQVSHDFADSREHALNGISLMGLQLRNSICSLDFLSSLPDVDGDRIGCTGGSGGGTQTFMAAAIDDRVGYSAPVNMISAHFQGGCLCENMPGLRLDTFNVEIGALAAPRPMLMVASTGDWTEDTPDVEYPMTRTIYELFDAEDALDYVLLDYPHNYNLASREAVYAWFAEWLLEAGDPEPYVEEPYVVELEELLLNFPGDEQPPGDMDESSLTDLLKQIGRDSLDAAWPASGETLEAFGEVYGTALEHVLYPGLGDEVGVDVHVVEELEKESFSAEKFLLSLSGTAHWIPGWHFHPPGTAGGAALLLHSRGKNFAAGEKADLIAILLISGFDVMLVDPFLVGEHDAAPSQTARNEDYGYFTTYNRTRAQDRVRDVLTALAFLHERHDDDVYLIGLDEEAGLWALLAAAMTHDLGGIVADGLDMRFDDDTLMDMVFMPGLARAGGIWTAAALAAPTPMIVGRTGDDEPERDLQAVYGLAGSAEALEIMASPLSTGDILSIVID